LGVATATTINGDTLTTGTYTLTGGSGKTLTFNNSLTLAGTDATTMTFPATSGTVATLNNAQTFTAAKTFTNSDLLLLGSSTGANTFTAANASSTNYTTTVPANTGTLAETNLAQSFSAAQTFGNSDIILSGSSAGATTFFSANSSATNYTLTFPAATDTVTLNSATQTLANKSIAATEVNSGTLACAQLPALTGDVTTSSGSCATTAGKVNGGSIPTSAVALASNGSNQIIAATTTGSGALVQATSPTLVTPALGTPASGTLTNTTGFLAANLAAGNLPSGVLANDGSTLLDTTNTANVSNKTIQYPYSTQSPTTGFSLTIPASTAVLVLNPSGTLASGTITMPASPVDAQQVCVTSSQTITALTVNANAGQSIIAAPTSMSAGGFCYFYVIGSTTWFRLY
jgi:hypothetical protein